MVAPKSLIPYLRNTPPKEKKRKFSDVTEQSPRRRSTRIAGLPASAPSLTEQEIVETEDKRRIRREGDFSMDSATSTQEEHDAVFAALKEITFVPSSSSSSANPIPPPSPVVTKKAKKDTTPTRISPRRKGLIKDDGDKENRANNSTTEVKGNKSKKKEQEEPEYELKQFEIADTNSYRQLQVAAVTKSVPDRIYNIAIHPSKERIVVATGDSWGRLGLWNYGTLDEQLTENELCVYKPHCAPVAGIVFSPSDASKLFTCSYDGSIRCADLHTGQFTQLHMKDETRTSLDVDPASSHILYSGSGNGVLTILDTRTPKVSEYEVHEKKMHSVSINPGNTFFLATASNDQTMCVWDIRKMKTPVHKFQHQQAVTSCGFSRLTGKYLVSFSYDNHIRIWHDYKEKAKLDHNCTTGRWITPFKIAWDPKNDSSFACGNMRRSLDEKIMNAETKTISAQLSDPEALTAIPSVNAFHQSLDVMASGTASGRTYVWKI